MLAVCPITSLPAFKYGGAKGGVSPFSIIRIIADEPPDPRATST